MAERSEAGWGVTQRVVNDRQYTFEIAIDLVVPKPQYTKSLVDEVKVSRFVARCMLIEIVLTAVDLYDETLLQANEIDDEFIPRRLPTEWNPCFLHERK